MTGPTTDGVTALPATSRWDAVPRRWRVVLVLLAGAVAVELALSLAGGVTGSPSPVTGPSSSLVRSATGTSALATLLGDDGYHVLRRATPLPSAAGPPGSSAAVPPGSSAAVPPGSSAAVPPGSSAAVPPGSTVVVLDPATWSPADTAALAGLARTGHRVVFAGRPPQAGFYRRVLGGATPPTWSPGRPGPAAAAAGAAPVAGVGPVDAGTAGHFTRAGDTTVLVAAAAGPVVVAGPTAIGPGAGGPRVELLASAAPLQNRALARVDDALLALRLVGPAGTTVVFDEYDHGVGRTTRGLGGLPLPWRVALGLAVAAAAVWVLQAARRFGPPEPADRALPPPRVAHVDAMGAVLASLPRAELAAATAPLAAEGRVRLCRHLGLPADADDAAILHAADRAGRHDDASAVLRPPTSNEELVAMGRVVSRLGRPAGQGR